MWISADIANRWVIQAAVVWEKSLGGFSPRPCPKGQWGWWVPAPVSRVGAGGHDRAALRCPSPGLSRVPPPLEPPPSGAAGLCRCPLLRAGDAEALPPALVPTPVPVQSGAESPRSTPTVPTARLPGSAEAEGERQHLWAGAVPSLTG